VGVYECYHNIIIKIIIMNLFSAREQIVETVHKLFIYTDYQKWNKILEEVFSEEVLFDMSSLGMEIKKTTAKDICEIWRNGFVGIDAVNHLAGNILVTIADDGAEVRGSRSSRRPHSRPYAFRRAALRGGNQGRRGEPASGGLQFGNDQGHHDHDGKIEGAHPFVRLRQRCP